MSQPTPSPNELIGKVLKGAYRLDSKLGEGGMGAVYRATQLTVDRQVAIKVLRPQVTNGDAAVAEQMQARFMREAKLTSKLEHPHTVSLIDFGETDDGMLFLVLELLRGQELSRVMHAEAPLPPHRVAAIGRQICQSLSEAHARGIIHRDLKPDNIFLCEYHGVKDHVKVVDFGIARIMGPDSDETSQLTATGLIIGTPKYMAPEQVQAQEITAQTDLYALGVIMYEMLMGSAPFHAESVMALAFKHVHEEPDPLPDSFGHGWKSIITQLLAKHPVARPTNADVVASILGTLEQQVDGEMLAGSFPAPSSGGRAAPPTNATSVHPVSQQTMGDSDGFQPDKKPLFLAIAVGVLIAIGTLALLLATGDDEGTPNSATQAAAAVSASPVDEAEDGDEPTAEEIAAAEEKEKQEALKAKEVQAAALAKAKKELEAEMAKKTAAAIAQAKGDATAKLVAKEAAKRVRVVLKSMPTGATVIRADNSILCTTPCDTTVAPTGAKEILKVQLVGHEVQDKEVSLDAGAAIVDVIALTKTPPVERPRATSKRRRKKTTKKPSASASTKTATTKKASPSTATTTKPPTKPVKKKSTLPFTIIR